jgi:hypothetical protein
MESMGWQKPHDFSRRRFQDSLGMLRRHTQQHASGSAGRASALFPMMQRADTDT